MNELNPSSKVDRSSPINRVNPKESKVAKKTSDSLSGSEADRVSLSKSSLEAAKLAEGAPASEIRQDLVNKFKNYLNEGSYEIKADEIADKIVQKIRESKNTTLLY